MGTAFTQSSNSLFSITTPLGKDKVLLRGFRGSEGMSRLFRFELDLLSEDQGITFTDIVGKNVTISVQQADGTPRYFNGVISRFGQGSAEGVFASYHKVQFFWDQLGKKDENSFLLDSRGARLGGQAVGHHLHSAHRPGSDGGFSGR